MSSISFRADAATERALAELMADGRDRSEVIREALVAAARVHLVERMRAQARELAADPEDRAEIARVQADLEPLRAW